MLLDGKLHGIKNTPGDIIHLYINVGIGSFQTASIEVSLYMSRQSHVASAIQRRAYMEHIVTVTHDTGLFGI